MQHDSPHLLDPFGDQKTRPYIGRISTVERELGSQRIATFIESNHDPSCYVGDPALLCTATGGVEQTPYYKLDRVDSLGGSGFFKSPICLRVPARELFL